ncbi:MAG: Bacterial alpha-L-rhamnosidase [Phycisphaera sp.]|nr:Bacterial alpha-L-rhamnosidase [Phycisphaera sp.]
MIERKDIVQTRNKPQKVTHRPDGTPFIAFERAVFGTLELTLDSEVEQTVTVHLGEKLAGPNTLDRVPPGCIRYRACPLTLTPGRRSYTLAIPPDARNTGEQAVLMPAHVGEVIPFRYAEIEPAAPGSLKIGDIRQLAAHYPFDDAAASFASSDNVLNAVWDMCLYTMKATSFCGVYVDGDRERIAYEADAYINQLGHYCVDTEFGIGRATLEHLVMHPTWPTEWQLHMPMMAWAEYLYSGDDGFLRTHYDDLRLRTLESLAREDGLISTQTGLVTEDLLTALHLGKPLRDIVDWPPGSFTQGGVGERDDCEMLPINTVVNAFHAHALEVMAKIARAIGRQEDASRFETQSRRVRARLNGLLFDKERGVYVDGEGGAHASLHANMFPLAFDLVPHDRLPGVVEFIKSRGMACSVYGAQYLLEALCLAGEADFALSLMTATHDRSWWNMIAVGSTMTLEAWDWKYKNNLDWNHAWGAAPCNIVPRYLMGIRPLEPGYKKVLIQPQPGSLEHAEIKLPTVRGSITMKLDSTPGKPLHLELDIPDSVQAVLRLPGSGDRVLGPGRHTLNDTPLS